MSLQDQCPPCMSFVLLQAAALDTCKPEASRAASCLCHGSQGQTLLEMGRGVRAAEASPFSVCAMWTQPSWCEGAAGGATQSQLAGAQRPEEKATLVSYVLPGLSFPLPVSVQPSPFICLAARSLSDLRAI